MLRSRVFTTEKGTEQAGDRRQACLVAAVSVTGVAALALAYAVTAGSSGQRHAPTPEELTNIFSKQWGSCFNRDPTTAEAQDLYGPFQIDGTTALVMKWIYDKAGNRTPNTVPVHMGADGRLEGRTLVFHYDTASGNFVPEPPTSYLTGNTCTTEPTAGVPQPHPQPSS